jgi:hypothetical protein
MDMRETCIEIRNMQFLECGSVSVSVGACMDDAVDFGLCGRGYRCWFLSEEQALRPTPTITPTPISTSTPIHPHTHTHTRKGYMKK